MTRASIASFANKGNSMSSVVKLGNGASQTLNIERISFLLVKAENMTWYSVVDAYLLQINCPRLPYYDLEGQRWPGATGMAKIKS
jgi:hypothetical protein